MKFPLRLAFATASLLALAAPILPAYAAPDAQLRPRVEVAFVLDTTGSMASLIDGAKRKIWSIANAIVDANPDAEIRMALIGYRDRGDAYVTDVHALTGDIQGLYGDLVQYTADGGGDTPESVNEALDKAVRSLQWDSGGQTRKIIFLVGDAPPHMDYPNAPRYPEVVKAAVAKGIVVNAVQAGDAGDTRQIWQDIARRGNGRYLPIPQDGGQIVEVPTPYDEDILQLQQSLDDTVLPYGDGERQQAVRNKMDLRKQAPAPAQVDNSSFYSKKAGPKEVVTGEGDLTADIANGRQSLDKVAASALPKVLQGKSDAERKAYVEEQLAKRKALQDKLAEINRKRDAFVTAERAKSGRKKADSFDSAVQETLRQQL
ncbi:vWA domain-containing protein [Labrys sp. ZIDIC5]|uniref:vWA domain-containing protein n=1 Tax=Labrys sedimenti TaxID=3106036 RepID=UPI002ACA4C00|nr:vWA domain-containing protein [Labrys sp. ZIDIC5]MDZ5449258.1 vWA domain-containing protein [Labrys sp. ZIDIC5]